MLTIFKYQLKVGAENEFLTARIVKVLHVAPANDHDLINVWCQVDDSAEQMAHFEIVGTGHEHPKPYGSWRYYGTAVMPGGLVWHVYGDPMWEGWR